MFRRNTATTQFTKLRIWLMLTLVACFFMFSAAVQATPLNLELLDFPDIFSGGIDVTHDAGADAFNASGFALTLDDDGIGPAEAITNGIFNISATIDDAGTATGLLTINGTIPTLGFNSGTLLTGNLTDFGFKPAGGDPLEFLFNVASGDAAGLYGTTAGVILSGTNFGGSFAVDFDNLIAGIPGTGSGVSNTAPPIPEPSTILLLMIGLGVVGGCSVLRKRGKQAKA